MLVYFFFFQAEDGIRDKLVTGVQTCALPILVRIPGLKSGQPGRFDEHSRPSPALGRRHAQLLEAELDVALHRGHGKIANSWNTIAVSGRPDGGDSNITSPADTGRSPATALSKVDLP